MYSYAEHRVFYGEMILSHPENKGNDFTANWAYAETLKAEYLGRIAYDFQKSCVTSPWDHKDSVSAKKYIKNFMLVYF
jgi:hypothetical protein